MDLTRLALRVRPAVDEAPHSFLDRLAIRHGCDTVAAFLDSVPSELAAPLSYLGRMTVLGLSVRQTHPASDVQPVLVSKLALSCAVAKAAVETDYPPICDKTFSRRRKICCSCIREDLNNRSGPDRLRIFRRNWWDLSSIHACPFHMVYLTTACPVCGEDIDKTLITPRHCRCGVDFSEVAVTHVDQADIASDKYLVGRISSRIIDANDFLDPMPLRIAAVCMAHVGRLATWGSNSPTSVITDPPTHVKVSTAGYRALADGKAGLDRFLDDKTAVETELKYLNVASRYGSLYRWLHLSKHDCLSQVRDVVLRHAADNFARSGRKALFGQNHVQTSHITFGTAVRKWRLKYKEAYCLARSLGINLDNEVTLKTAIKTSDYEVVGDWLACHVNSVDAMTLLNLKPHVFDNIVKEGILRRTDLQYPGRSSFYLKADIARLLQDACQAAPTLAEAPAGCLGLLEAVRSRGAVACIIKRLLEGSIRAEGILQACAGLPAILVSVDEKG